MGLTGAGITSEDQINMSESNTFTNKWGMPVSIRCVVIESDDYLGSPDQRVISVAVGDEGVD
jgi:hypothetical protein